MGPGDDFGLSPKIYHPCCRDGAEPILGMDPQERPWGEKFRKEHKDDNWLVVWLPSILFSQKYWVSNHPN